MSELSNAKIHFNDQGTPVASDFDDVYFSNDGGIAETDYVFLQQNGLPQRWPQHPTAAFHIIETGFGTGANFLLTWLRFRQHRHTHPHAQCQRLYFSSFEKYPLSHADLTRALAVHDTFSDLCQLLLDAYPLCIAGCHRLSLDNGSVILDLWFGDVNSQLPQLTSEVDAVYLDGFAPSKNPDMWQDTLFSNLARLSKNTTTVSTFTSAGIVKRGLQAAGFTVTKIKGFGRKREMLTATIIADTNLEYSSPKDVTIVGGGIASLCTALALTQRGVNVHLICEDSEVAQQASQNRQGAVYPNLHANLTDDSQIHVQAFLFARRFYQYWHNAGVNFAMDWCGMLHLATNSQLKLRQEKLIANALWPAEIVRAVDASAASEIAGLPLQQAGIYFPLAGWLNPQQFCQQALTYLALQPTFTFSAQCHIDKLEYDGEAWQLCTTNGNFTASAVVLACGSKMADFEQTAMLPVNKIRGQVSHIKQPAMTPLKTVLCHKGYITPQWQGEHSIGATFDRSATDAFVSEQDDQINMQLINDQLQQPDWFLNPEVKSAAAAFRATVPDHLPLAGALQANQLYVLGAMGARGILLSPLLAELVACQICKDPLPLAQELVNRIRADRFR
ncbi:bifunctional tRNA (5-methylaminomethyl-2-thiouridine)(34)-methyltransferase MnmD/FAD-dependent 5-carboxymethylaminomethyl-2-thiouridine(34) oxidoreductase MnmC [Rheinheimera baltica]|uniref:bifunctional tRNA (5-methylaminomethyl-2-thiouridine)(34)-methyltransferase MnmD/FAD-dependent 5-carboxymethylaminomethyl-2-thiouridine(34) oxidoreductase MnmC n=2 Tax=Rheinheimera baltica TaxID=67576 RepID=UPI00273F1354|nr:bifunctional tRNA (5-methylaminomethyl-2-thiouridine)(34)-methyltransferase MnmD/FAD-dependent 5-carboxymethylaminomethyl-2-thiouridine(34) oxidoreductase MnmC [Rheinheimera baltica]MDP5141700.1 bifunctional tRNA (5-methylaminomethyl-2-thiouridine)(34)-methyltransferase MnmD/FAD-dependent 5-carboxymethylaminomethyl-2-thiouridine(34) oxidoreductase MnmC [Rheinheimera baltica]